MAELLRRSALDDPLRADDIVINLEFGLDDIGVDGVWGICEALKANTALLCSHFGLGGTPFLLGELTLALLVQWR